MVLWIACTGFIVTGCSHSDWVKFEEQTRAAGFIAAPMGLVNLVGKVGRLVTNDETVVCQDCEPPPVTKQEVEK
jgi:hypothetical protein